MGWGCNGGVDEDRGGVGPESGGYRDDVGGGISRGGEGSHGGRGVGDTDGKGVSWNDWAVTKLLPEEVLDVLVRLGTTPAWAC